MPQHPANRLPSFWPSQSADTEASPTPDVKRLAARLDPAIESMGTAIAEHPRVSLTLAAALGALAGWYIKRK